MEDAPQQSFEFRVPEDLAAGAYANVVGVWHTPHEFTIDFSVTQPPTQTPDGGVKVPCEVVARVKIAPTLVFDLLRTLNENMTRYEAALGEIRRPGSGPEQAPGQG